MSDPIRAELAQLKATAENLSASIAKREALAPTQGPDYVAVTAHERERLTEVQARIARLDLVLNPPAQ